MNRRFLYLVALTAILLSACAPQTPATPTVDVAGTMAVQLASMMMTQTVAAYSPTPPPAPTFTVIPPVTEKPIAPPAPVETAMPKVKGYAPCYKGPGETYTLVSNISDTKLVEIVGIGSVEGWYVIVNPYFNVQCWISAENLVLDPGFDAAAYPIIAP